MKVLAIGSAAVFILGIAPSLTAQQPGAPRAWEFAGVPAVSFDSDEGFGYGVVGEIYNYGAGGSAAPYRFTLQPTVQFSTNGRRDVILFFDAPRWLPGGWRLTAFGASERQIATPWYGVGNDTEYDASRDVEDGPNPYYYRFGRSRTRLLLDFQRAVAGTPFRLLLGGGFSRVSIDATPRDDGTTLLADGVGDAQPSGWFNYLRGGLTWDTRDREVGPRRGVWSEVLVQRVDEGLGSETGFTRWTVTDRRYFSAGPRVVFANRFVLQGTHGEVPFHELHVVQTSGRPQEGLGGAKTLRGIPKNRYTGDGLFLWNAEVRWHAADFEGFGRPFHLVLSGFLDSGRTWADGPNVTEVLRDLHHGFGGGVRLGMGENFVVALDAGHSVEATAPFYIGLGYLY